jgi:TolA-binding protein
MLKFIFKKSAQDIKKENKMLKVANNIKENSEKLASFIDQRIGLAQQEFVTIKEKTKDLRSTNYDLGLKHLENGHLKEASMRFFLMTKFWPDFYDAYYQLAYCLVLRGKIIKAQNTLIELLEKKPDFNPLANELLDYINDLIADAQKS